MITDFFGIFRNLSAEFARSTHYGIRSWCSFLAAELHAKQGLAPLAAEAFTHGLLTRPPQLFSSGATNPSEDKIRKTLQPLGVFREVALRRSLYYVGITKRNGQHNNQGFPACTIADDGAVVYVPLLPPCTLYRRLIKFFGSLLRHAALSAQHPTYMVVASKTVVAAKVTRL